MVVHRSSSLEGPWEGRVALRDRGIAQGGLVDTPDGRWFAYLFRDYGAVGRIPYLCPITWEDGWPVFGIDGKVPFILEGLPKSDGLIGSLAGSDDFSRSRGDVPLPLFWQWNHVPDDSNWSVTERKGWLRLRTGRVDKDFLQARNTLTQRTIGPTSKATTKIDVTHMRDGDFAGLALLQKHYGQIGIKMENGQKKLVMINAESDSTVVGASIPLNANIVFLRAECDFTELRDEAEFFYSLDGNDWKRIGSKLKMTYTVPQFIGYRFALFNYATEQIGGYADFDYIKIEK